MYKTHNTKNRSPLTVNANLAIVLYYIASISYIHRLPHLIHPIISTTPPCRSLLVKDRKPIITAHLAPIRLVPNINSHIKSAHKWKSQRAIQTENRNIQ